MLLDVYGSAALKHAVAQKNNGVWEVPLEAMCRQAVTDCANVRGMGMEFYFHTESNGFGDWDLFIKLSVTSRATGRAEWDVICERIEATLREQIGDIRVRVEPLAVLLRS